MTPERQIEAMARIDGLEPTGDETYPYSDGKTRYFASCSNRWDYLGNYNAAHRVLASGKISSTKYRFYLHEIMKPKGQHAGLYDHAGEVMYATCAQMTEAILRACGTWED